MEKEARLIAPGPLPAAGNRRGSVGAPKGLLAGSTHWLDRHVQGIVHQGGSAEARESGATHDRAAGGEGRPAPVVIPARPGARPRDSRRQTQAGAKPATVNSASLYIGKPSRVSLGGPPRLTCQNLPIHDNRPSVCAGKRTSGPSPARVRRWRPAVSFCRPQRG